MAPVTRGLPAHGNVAPTATIAGSKTKLEFAPNANGNVAPIRTIAGSKTKLVEPCSMAFDSADNLYVADQQGRAILEFAVGAKATSRQSRIFPDRIRSCLGHSASQSVRQTR